MKASGILREYKVVGVLLAHRKVPATRTTAPNVHLHTLPRSDPSPAYGTGVAVKEDEEVTGEDSAPWAGV